MKRWVLVFIIVLPLLAVSCGGGGGGDGETPSSNWDEMVWDQDNWA
jgi:hypothetical protein